MPVSCIRMPAIGWNCLPNNGALISAALTTGVSRDARLLFPDVDRRQRVADVIDGLNDRIAGLAQEHQIPPVDFHGVGEDLLGTHYAPIASHEVGGQMFCN